GVLGVLDDPSRVLKIAFRNAGDVIVLLDGASLVGARHVVPSSGAAHISDRHSERSPRSEESLVSLRRDFSSSEYSKRLAGTVAPHPPAIDLAAENRLIDCLVALASAGPLHSAHDISDGGLAVAVAESCFASAHPKTCHSEPSEESAVSILGADVTLNDP